MEQKKVLIADSDEEFSQALTTALKAHGYQVVSAADAVSAIKTAVGVQPDLVILDSALPGGGFKTAERMRLLADLDLVPMILLSQGARRAAAQAPVGTGTEVYLSKPVDADFLARCVGRELGAAQAPRLTERPGKKQLFDGTTELYNREAFLVLTEHQMRVSDRTRKGFALVLLKMGNLEGIREAHGALEAEHALVQAGRILKDSFRGSDVIAHVGEDEFAVLVLETKSVGRELLTRRLYKNLKHLNSETPRLCRLTLDAHVVSYDPLHPVTLSELLKDLAAYRTKEAEE